MPSFELYQKINNAKLNQQQSADIAHYYALARICGFTKSFDDFSAEYSKYFDEAYEKVYSPQPATAEPIQNPFRKH